MRLHGETVTVITWPDEIERDDRGRPLPGQEIRAAMPGCVIVPRGSSVNEMSGAVGFYSAEEVDVYVPCFTTVEVGDTLEIRDETWHVSAEPFDHRSPFATGRGGTQIPAARGAVTDRGAG